MEQERGIDIPGGHSDNKESPLETMRRETMEEVGIDIQEATIVAILQWSNEYRGIWNPKMVYFSAEWVDSKNAEEAFSKRALTHAHEASSIVFMKPQEFLKQYAIQRKEPGHIVFIENMRIAIESAVEQYKKGVISIGLSALGDHQVRWHLVPLNVDSRVREILVFDPLWEESLTNLREKYALSYEGIDRKIQWTVPDYKALIDSDTSAVFISSPDRFHIPQMTEALNAGKHVFCEKPLVDTLGEVPKLVENIISAREKWLILSSCHPRRFDRPFTWLKKYLSEDAGIGKVLKMEFDFKYPAPEPGKEWLHAWLLADHFNHEIDLVNFYFGFSHFEAKKISDSQEEYGAQWKREDGIEFHFSGTRKKPRDWEYAENITIFGENWSIRVDTETGEAVLTLNQENPVILEKGLHTDYIWRFQKTTSNFIDAIVAGGRNYLTPMDLLINNLSGVVLTEQKTFSSRDYQEMMDLISPSES